TLSAVRDLVRHELKTSQPDKFPIGHTGTDIRDLLQSMFQKPNQKDISYEKCSDCNYEATSQIQSQSLIFITCSSHKSTQSNFKHWQNQKKYCGLCTKKVCITRYFTISPSFICFSLEVKKIISKYIKIENQDKSTTRLSLKGIIYSGSNHFTSRFIVNNEIWYHDGISTGSKCIKEGHLDDFEGDLLFKCKKKEAVVVIYGV
ncbi:hypothetical protein GALMADRAFT_79064, partial [Galerina marginata CBS 339.88]